MKGFLGLVLQLTAEACTSFVIAESTGAYSCIKKALFTNEDEKRSGKRYLHYKLCQVTMVAMIDEKNY